MGVAIAKRFVPAFERLANRYLLGLEPDPDIWPKPANTNSIPVAPGIPREDSYGQIWSLDREHSSAWHRRRTVAGAQAYRFSHNTEYDCGWRLVDAAARFLDQNDIGKIDLVTIVPQPLAFGQAYRIEWMGQRLADVMGARLVRDLFTVTVPYSIHPDIRRPAFPLAEVFDLADMPDVSLDRTRVLLLDWRFHRGRTLATLARKLTQCEATVVRFTWLS